MDTRSVFIVKKPRAKLFLYGALNFVLFAMLAALFYGTLRVSQDIVSKRQEIETLSLVVAQAVELREASGVADAAFAELQKILPDTDRLLFVSTELEAHARAHGMLFGFHYGAVHEGPPRAIFFTMSLEGSLYSLMGYLGALTRELPYIMHVLNIDVAMVTDGQFRAVISGKLFIL